MKFAISLELPSDLENLKRRSPPDSINVKYESRTGGRFFFWPKRINNPITTKTNPNKGIQTKHGVNFFSPHKGWSSGPTALWFAATQEHKSIYIFGFDYQGLNGKFNNIYADTFNYKKSTDAATYHGNWLSQTEKVIKEFRHTHFFRVIEPGAFIPDRLGPALTNLSHITYDEFSRSFPDTIYSDQINQKTTI